MSQSLVKLAKMSMKEEGNQVKLMLASKIAGYYAKQHFYDPSDETLSVIDTTVLLLRSILLKEFYLHREKEVAGFSQHVNLTVEKVEEASHDIYWDCPATVCNQIFQWIEK